MKQYDVVTSGYVSMDRIIKILTPARAGRSTTVANKDNAQIYYGGCSVNIAYILAKMGKSAMPCIRVGGDYKETGFYDFLREGGVRLNALEVLEDETTTNSYMVTDPDHNHITMAYPGAMDEKYAHELDPAYFENARIGVMTVASPSDNREFFKGCREAGLPVMFGMKADKVSFPEAFLREIVCYSKGIFANFSEKRFIEQELGLLDLTELFGMGSTEVIVITLGKDGSLCYEKTAGSYKVTEIPVAKGAAVVDTVGSGDAYIAGFLYGYLNGCVPVECCRMGSVMASFILEKRGCLSSVPEKEEFIKHYEAYRQNTEGDKSR